MDDVNPTCVITTINRPTRTTVDMVDRFPNVIVIGDKKTPDDWSYAGAKFYSYQEQQALDFNLKVPDNHYARKNLGYLLAMRQNASLIYDIDDDNYPVGGWKMRDKECQATSVAGSWCNVYQRFTRGPIWPRGFALEHVNELGTIGASFMARSPIQQGLADGNTDVDAIWRLTMQRDVTFSSRVSLALTGAWCPFNSQTTWWWPEAYHLMYLPIYSTFRMCDIWRSFVAQRCLWALGHSVVFHSPAEVFQDRNPHDLLADFKDEIPGYLNNGMITKILGNLKLTGSKHADMLMCYEALVSEKFLPEKEMLSLYQWLRDIDHENTV